MYVHDSHMTAVPGIKEKQTRKMFIRITTFVSLLLLKPCQAVSTVQVFTPVGSFEGLALEASFNGTTKPVSVFMGIPFGESTAGPNRFSKPVPKAPLTSTYNATYFRPGCAHVPVIGLPPIDISEDCLFLNVFVPTHDISPRKKYPVLIWIYGGAFSVGASNYYIPDTLSTFGDVIVVTINYRIHAFGFLSTGDKVSPGNYGLWDQHLAIKWVNEHIGNFGGDSNSVTLFGESAGAASVMMQALYPENKGLFHRVIAQSGAPLCYWATTPTLDAKSFGAAFQCKQQDMGLLIECLQQVDMESMLRTIETRFPVDRFVPVIDNDFFKLTFEEILQDESCAECAFFTSLDILSGVNDKEGFLEIYKYMYYFAIEDLNDFTITPSQFQGTVIPDVLADTYPNQEIPATLRTALVHQYTDWKDPSNLSTIRNMMLDLASDSGFFIPAIKMTDTHAKITSGGKTFFYLFTAPSMLFPRPGWLTGANHADDIIYVFGFSGAMLAGSNFTASQTELRVSADVMTFWTNFAKTGDPNRPMKVPSTWPPYVRSTSTRNYMEISPSASVPRERFNEPRTSFWLYLVPAMLTEFYQLTFSNATESPGVFSERFKIDGLTAENIIIALSVVIVCLLLVLLVTCILLIIKRTRKDTYEMTNIKSIL